MEIFPALYIRRARMARLCGCAQKQPGAAGL